MGDDAEVPVSQLGDDWRAGDDGVMERDAARAIVLAGPRGAQHLLMVRGHDVDQPGRSWWFTPGGGIEPGEAPRVAAAREVAEESGLVLDADALVGPVFTRRAVFDFFARTCRQREVFYLAELEAGPEALGDLADAGWTDVERATLDELAWFSLADLAEVERSGVEVYPAGLPALVAGLVDRLAEQRWDGEPVDLGEAP